MYINENLEAVDPRRPPYGISFNGQPDTLETRDGDLLYRVYPFEDHPAYEAPGELDILESTAYDIIDGKAYEVRTYREMTVEEKAERMASLKASNKATIDQAVEAKRLQYLTPGSGQSMAYEQKYNEAAAFKAAENPDVSDFPHIESEVGITAPTAEEVADVIIAVRQQWVALSAALEGLRLGYKKAVNDATLPSEVHAAMMAFSAALESID